jgi:hypothetical protein
MTVEATVTAVRKAELKHATVSVDVVTIRCNFLHLYHEARSEGAITDLKYYVYYTSRLLTSIGAR